MEALATYRPMLQNLRIPQLQLPQWVIIFLGLMVLQDTVNLYLDHRYFATSSVCTKIHERLAAGRFAEEYCALHESYAYNAFSIRNWLFLFAHANWKLLIVYAIILAAGKVILSIAYTSAFLDDKLKTKSRRVG